MLKKAEIIEFARILIPKIWYTGKELDAIWSVASNKRRNIVPSLVRHNILRRRGATSLTQYKLIPESNWLESPLKKKKPTAAKPIETTGNAVIDAKLRKEAGLPELPSSLEDLINAATNIGSENESLKQALRDISSTITKVQEYL